MTAGLLDCLLELVGNAGAPLGFPVGREKGCRVTNGAVFFEKPREIKRSSKDSGMIALGRIFDEIALVRASTDI